MFKWLEKFLARPYEKAAEQAIIDKTEKPKDISEPVISFVECVKKNPKRFEVNEILDHLSVSHVNISKISVKDFYTGDIFETTKTEFYLLSGIQTVFKNFSVFTVDEVEYVYKELRKIYSKRLERKNKILSLRAERKNKKERERLMKVYCNE